MFNKIAPHLTALFEYKTPYDLGLSDNKFSWEFDLLFNNPQMDAAWKELFPANYYFNHKIRPYIYLAKRKLSDAKWYILHHTTYRYHIVNLSQPDYRNDTIDHYKYGYRDTDRRLVFAMFNLVMDYIENTLDNDLSDVALEGFPTDESLIEHNKFLAKLREINKYWKNDRLKHWREIDKLRDTRGTYRKTDKIKFRELSDTIYKEETKFFEKEKEMMALIIDIYQNMVD